MSAFTSSSVASQPVAVTDHAVRLLRQQLMLQTHEMQLLQAHVQLLQSRLAAETEARLSSEVSQLINMTGCNVHCPNLNTTQISQFLGAFVRHDVWQHCWYNNILQCVCVYEIYG